MNESDIKLIDKIDKYVSDANNELYTLHGSTPFSFIWSLPSNHVHGDRISYFTIWLKKSLPQETRNSIETNKPITLLYFFGKLNNLKNDGGLVPKDIETLYDHWNESFTTKLSRYITSTERMARGHENMNYNYKITTHPPIKEDTKL